MCDSLGGGSVRLYFRKELFNGGDWMTKHMQDHEFGIWPSREFSGQQLLDRPHSVILRRGDQTIDDAEFNEWSRQIQKNLSELSARPTCITCSNPRPNFFAFFVSHDTGTGLIEDKELTQTLATMIVSELRSWLSDSEFSFVLYRDDNNTKHRLNRPIAHVTYHRAGDNQDVNFGSHEEEYHSIINHKDVQEQGIHSIPTFVFLDDKGLEEHTVGPIVTKKNDQLNVTTLVVRKETDILLGPVAIDAALMRGWGVVSLATSFIVSLTSTVDSSFSGILHAVAIGLFVVSFIFYSLGSTDASPSESF